MSDAGSMLGLMLAGAAGRESGPDRGGPAEVRAQALTEIGARYQEPCPFSSGELVVARRGTLGKCGGRVCVVLDVFAVPEEPRVPSSRIDLRLATIDTDGDVVFFPAESWEYERYDARVGERVVPEAEDRPGGLQ